ncbi:MAG: PAS domain-containing protein [Ectothiorhodospiraceae bacterium]|nr:PAS domain-containing protein [Ectothiorhodospiraceae bacterium]
MTPRRLLWLLILPPALALIVLALAAAGPVSLPPLLPLALTAGALAVLVATWLWLDRDLLTPIRHLAEAMQLLSMGKPPSEAALPRGALLSELVDSLHLLSDDLSQARREASRAAASGTVGLEDEKRRLEVVLGEIRDGVLVCDREGRILLCNPAAGNILQEAGSPIAGRSVYDLWARAPVEHSLQLLQYRRHASADSTAADRHVEFVSATLNRGLLLHCRMSLLPASATLSHGFLITFDDVTRKMETVLRRDQTLRQAVQTMRSPLANLRAAAENLAREPAMEQVDRERFQEMIARESRELSRCLDWMATESQALLSAPWSMADIQTSDLIASIRLQPCGETPLPVIRESGFPLWLHADSHAVSLLLGHLLRHLVQARGADSVDVEALLGDRRVYLDLRWRGGPLQSDVLEAWLAEPLPAQPAALTGLQVLERHDSVAWSQWDTGNPRHSVLRIPLPASQRQWEQPLPVNNRREFHSPITSSRPESLGAEAETALERLSYVAFDTETTGVDPQHGDEIIWIAGFRVRNGHILPGQTFDELVRPRHPIPRASTAIHGVRNSDVTHRPPIEEVLPRFHQFTEGAVLVGHNADFDMQFIHMQESACGVRFDRPVMDTLLLSMLLHEHTTEHSLEAIAWRLGVPIANRHTAPGDARLTAEVFVRMLPPLRDKGIQTLGQALDATMRMVDVRRRQAQLRETDP